MVQNLETIFKIMYVKLKSLNTMNYLILGAFGINAYLIILLMVVFYQSIRGDLNSGFKKLNHFSHRCRRNLLENNRYDESTDVGSKNKFKNWDHWDLSGGIFGI